MEQRLKNENGSFFHSACFFDQSCFHGAVPMVFSPGPKEGFNSAVCHPRSSVPQGNGPKASVCRVRDSERTTLKTAVKSCPCTWKPKKMGADTRTVKR